MGRKSTPIILSVAERDALDELLARTDSRKMARRIQIVLFKSQNEPAPLSNVTIADKLGVQPVTVANWVRRYRAEGINGLQSRPIPGRPNIFDLEKDAKMVRDYVTKHRQQLKIAHQLIEEHKGCKMSKDTLERFLKSLVHASGESV